MIEGISPFFQWLNAHPEFSGLVTFLISAGESVAILGTIVPGSIMMTALGTLAGAGVIPLWSTIFWAILGAIAGDGISYWLGHHYKDRLHRYWPFRNYPKLLKSGETFVMKHGGMSVFIGRFVGPVRAIVPLVAGMLGMKPLKFMIANITSAIGWAPAYMLPGILLGAASLELPPDIAVHVMLVILLLTLLVLLCLWFVYKSLKLIHGRLDHIQTKIWIYLKTRRLTLFTFLLKHHQKDRMHGQLNLAFYFLLTGFLFICLALYVKHYGPADITINDAFFHFSRGIRTATLDHIMIAITLLGQKEVVLPVVFVFFAWLIYLKHWRVAFHALALTIFAAGGNYVIKHIIQSPRPWGITVPAESFSMPSGHTTLATTLFMGLAFLIANAIRPKYRIFVYSIGILISFSVGISRIYLGAHWFTDVLAAWLLSISVLLFVIISYERKKEAPINPIMILLVSFIPLIFTYGYYYSKHVTSFKYNYSQLNWPFINVDQSKWWQNNTILPTTHVSLFGIRTQTINIEWAGDLEDIKKSLLEAGWELPPARDWISTLHRIADVKSTEYLPMVSPQYLDKKPELILIRPSKGTKKPLVLRLWDSHRILLPGNTHLLVGMVNVIPRTYGWLYRNQPDIKTITPNLVFPTQLGASKWEWKIISIPNKKHTSVLLIREKNVASQKK